MVFERENTQAVTKLELGRLLPQGDNLANGVGYRDERTGAVVKLFR
jgi:hypothetical protein